MLKIRLMRIGAKKRPFYRVVVIDERSKRGGAYKELLGTYDPMTTPHEIKLKQDRIDYWLKQGAQKSDGFLRIIGEAPQIAPRKPKKEKKEEPKKAPEVVTEEAPAEEPHPKDDQPLAETETTPEEPATTETEVAMDNSAVKPESTDSEESESIQAK